MSNSERGILFVVSSPSGAGKTTLCRRLQQKYQNLRFSISYTTRPKRGNEVNGVDYHFVDREKFDEMVKKKEFAEWAEVHGNFYGTSWATIRENVEKGCDVLFDIDWQGATTLKTSEFGDDTVMVFVLPPSMDELARRLRSRGTDAKEVVERRLAKAMEELGHFNEYDYLVYNDNIDTAYAELEAIYHAEHCTKRRRRQLGQGLLEQIKNIE